MRIEIEVATVTQLWFANALYAKTIVAYDLQSTVWKVQDRRLWQPLVEISSFWERVCVFLSLKSYRSVKMRKLISYPLAVRRATHTCARTHSRQFIDMCVKYGKHILPL